MPRKSTVTKEQVEQAIALYKEGASLKRIEEATATDTHPGVVPATLYHHLRQAGIHPNRQGKERLNIAAVATYQSTIRDQLRDIQLRLDRIEDELKRSRN